MTPQQITALKDFLRHCFCQVTDARQKQPLPSWEALLAQMPPPDALDADVRPLFHQLLQTGMEVYQHFAERGEWFVGIDDGESVLCLPCVLTLQGSDAIPDVAAWCQRFAICETAPVAACLNCELCNEALIPCVDPGANTSH